MRITTNMIMRNYQSRLNATLTDQTNKQYQVMTGKRYQYAWQDPSSSASAASLTRRYLRNKDYLSNIDDAQSYQDAQEDSIRQISDIAKNIDKYYSVTAISDTTGQEGRASIASSLRELQNSIVESLNTKYGDDFVLAGADGKNVPFTMENGKLCYRGLDVEAPENQEKLKEMAGESVYIDLGFGLTFDDKGEVVSSSAFDTSLPGINVVGFGKDDAGVSNNMVNLIGQMADILEKEDFDSAAYEKLWTKFNKQSNNVIDMEAKLGAKTQLLTATKTRLEDMDLSLEEQLDTAMNIDPAEAIMNLSWSQYAYNVALRIGTNIISPSLLDFMK